MAADGRVFILDQISTRAGDGEAIWQLYQEGYAPAAEARGMKRELSLVAPPLWLKNQGNILYFLWSVEGVAGWWTSMMQARRDLSLAEWWRRLDARVVKRERHYLTDAALLPELADV